MSIKTKILDFFGLKTKQSPPEEIEKQRSSYAESPQMYVFDQFKVATDRISTIREVRELIKRDLRFKMTNLRLAADATRGGCRVIVQGSEAHRAYLKRQGKQLPKRLVPGANIAQQVIDDFMRRTKLSVKSEEHLRSLLRDGDLFLNPIVDMAAGLVLDVRRAPALTMKRNSDAYGEFPDPERAFSQIDPLTQINALMDIGPPGKSRTDFALFQMNHIRWLSEETEHYGTSHYASARKTFKILEKMEMAAAIRREFRSVQKLSHRLPEGTQQKDAQEYARDNRIIDENGNPTKNAHLLSDFVGTAEVKAIQGDANLSEMADIEYFDDLLWLNLGVPKAVLTSGQNINRDILKVQYPQYLQSLDDMTDTLEYGDVGPFSGYRALIDLQLLLAGINPESIAYDVVWTEKSTETASERLERVQNALGKGGGSKLITTQKAIQEIADDFDIEDPVELAAQIEEEKEKEVKLALAVAAQNAKQATEGDKPDDEPVTDVVLEDRPEFDKFEAGAKAEVLRFFHAVTQRMSSYESDAVTDSAIMDYSEDEILSAFTDAWEAEQGKYQRAIVKYMLAAGLLGAEQAAQLVEGRSQSIRPRIVRTDIRDDLMNESGSRIKGIEETTRKQIQSTLADGFTANAGWKEIMKQVQPIIENPIRAELIARTELSWAYNRSAKRIYADAGFTKVEWSAVIDARTCPVCRERHGKVYPIDEHPDIPAHPRCKCTLLPSD
ncbi:portal protein [Brevibacillus sp. HD3.3A]|uniref:minor capsid protein n=1 Tax=Brevibacillus sp. HD3.3A TaxID=2738979 RepID=UPI001E40449A|nr:portal protein [Brevibacillus sp. HD3.3A]UED72147.1 minor capsid protein [Brevibacillus sp. HD3.3A]